MARKKPARPAARKAKKKPAPASAARKRAKTAARKVVTSVRKAAQKAGRRAVKSVKKAAKPLKKLASRARATVKKAGKTPSGRRAVKAVRAAVAAAKTPNLDRPRKTVADIHGVPSSWGARSTATAAQTGRAELQQKLKNNTSVSPALTAGDVDADWQSAESSGNESPGGDNPTPDQDVVDEIGRALGVEYQDDEELQGGDEITERDRHRWELDPNSAEDFDDKD